MRVRYLYSACIVIETPDLRLACDPWMTDGIYEGSWIHYPPLPGDPIDQLGKVDAIWISHIHPDHYDPRFLQRYLERHPRTRIWISEMSAPHLHRKMRADGIPHEVHARLQVGDTRLTMIENRSIPGDIDAALVVARGDLSVANLNDNHFDPLQIAAVRAACPGGRPTLACLPYAGAGPYPQCFHFDSKQARRTAAREKREAFLRLYQRYVRALDPVRALPFAGKYLLAGPLADLNELRGVPDALEAAAREPEISVVLADGGDATLDLETLEASELRRTPYDPEAMRLFLRSHRFRGFDWEREIRPLDGRPLPILPLLRAAYERIHRSGTPVRDPLWLCLQPDGESDWIVLGCHARCEIETRARVDDLEPRMELHLDARHLFGLLTRLYHWNNADVGSLYRARRVPDVFRREVQGFLSELRV